MNTPEQDAALARRLGLGRPYTSGPRVGRCPGGAEYGHGMSLTTVHAGGCCAEWDRGHQAAQADFEPEADDPEPEAEP